MYLCKSLNRKRLTVSQDTIEMKDYKETLSEFDKDYYKNLVQEKVERYNEIGHVCRVSLRWRGKYYHLQLFFPGSKFPSRKEVENQVHKIYPDATVMVHYASESQPNQPLIRVSENTEERNPNTGLPDIKKEIKSESKNKGNIDDPDLRRLIPESGVLDERLGGKGYKPYTSMSGEKVSGDWEDSDRGAGNRAKKRAGGKVEKKSPTYLAHVHNKESYETKKKEEVLTALKKRDLKKSAKEKIAADIVKRKGDTSKSDDRYAYEEVVVEKDLNAAERRALPDKEFALPGKGKGPEGKQAGSYPIPDKTHARMALAMVAKHGTPEKKKKVRAAVEKKFPGIKVTEDKAFNSVVAALRKKHGKDAVLTKDSPKPKPPSAAEKAKASAERKKRQDADNKAYTARARKAGYKNTQDYTNVVARYGSEDNYRKGKGLGT